MLLVMPKNKHISQRIFCVFETETVLILREAAYSYSNEEFHFGIMARGVPIFVGSWFKCHPAAEATIYWAFMRSAHRSAILRLSTDIPYSTPSLSASLWRTATLWYNVLR